MINLTAFAGCFMTTPSLLPLFIKLRIVRSSIENIGKGEDSRFMWTNSCAEIKRVLRHDLVRYAPALIARFKRQTYRVQRGVTATSIRCPAR